MLPFAFSIHNFISSVGADAGFAAIVGLAVLVLLYFAHARETANLREEAALLTQRLHQAEARVLQLSRSQSAAAAQAPAAAAAPASDIAAFAPAFTAAPALGSATRVIAAGPAPALTPPAIAPVPVAAPVMAMAGVSAASPAQAAAPPVPAAAPQPAIAPVPAPATNAGGNGASHQPPPPARVPATAQRVPSRSLPPLEPPRRHRRSRVGRGVVVALVALAAVAAGVVLFALTSVSSSKNSSVAASGNAPSHASVATFKASSVTVAVLNGTAVNELAHHIAGRLSARGYRTGTIATAANQTESATAVAYLSGKGDRTDALHVATALGLRASAVRPIDQGTLQVACPTSSACAANVVVTVGSDLAGQ